MKAEWKVTLPSPLPWKVSFDAKVTSFNGEEVELTAEADGIEWETEVRPWDIEWAGPVESHPEERYAVDHGNIVRVTLEPLS